MAQIRRCLDAARPATGRRAIAPPCRPVALFSLVVLPTECAGRCFDSRRLARYTFPVVFAAYIIAMHLAWSGYGEERDATA